MRKLLAIIALLIGFTFSAFAQMSDEKVIEFIQKEQKHGSSQGQIVTKLMQKGVKIDQIRKIKKKYDAMGNNDVSGARNLSPKTKRTRTGLKYDEASGQMVPAHDDFDNDDVMKNTSQLRDSKKLRRNTHSESDPLWEDYDMDDEDDEWNIMQRELNTFMPDSAEMLKMRMRMKKRKRIFGHDIFNNNQLSFEPNMNIATPENYVLGPGDAVFIDIYGATQKSIEETVSPDGEVVIEGYGPVKLSGMTVKQANQKLRNTVGARYASSQIKLTIGETRSILVNVMGEVKVPGTYTLSAFSTVFHALYSAGGISNLGSLRNIKVYRKEKLISTVDVYDYILNGKLSGNIKLTDNDVIVVEPYDCIVSVSGKVKRPMYYEMKNSESLLTLIKYAGGFKGDAYKKSLRVVRNGGKERSVYNIAEFDMATFMVNDQDSVIVDANLERFSNMVQLKGAVFRPGMYQLGANISSVKQLVEFADGLTESAFAEHAIMHRMKEDRTLEVLSVDLKGILAGTATDIPLRNEDVLFVPNLAQMNKERTLSIYGEVMYPGLYDYADNESVEDLILQAGGLTESGSVLNVEVNRRINDNKSTETSAQRSTTFKLTLNEGFIVGGDEGFKLQPFDQVYIRKNPGYREVGQVEIDGEVVFRGNYSLDKHDMRLSDVVERAGGVTEYGYAKGAYLVRQMTEKERDRVEEYVKQNMELLYNNLVDKTNGISYNPQQQELNLDSVELHRIIAMGVTYRVGINLDKAIKKPGCESDLVLRDGDVLVIPEYNNTITIRGEVNYPNTTTYRSGKGWGYYLAQGGGVTDWGKKRNAYIIRPNGQVGTRHRNKKIEPGSEIVVPHKSTRPNTDSLQKWLSVGTSVGSFATMIATVVNLMGR